MGGLAGLGALAGLGQGLENAGANFRSDQLEELKRQEELAHEQRIREDQIASEKRQETRQIASEGRAIQNTGLLGQQAIDLKTNPKNVKALTDAQVQEMQAVWPTKLSQAQQLEAVTYHAPIDRDAVNRDLRRQILERQLAGGGASGGSGAGGKLSQVDRMQIQIATKKLEDIDTELSSGMPIDTERQITLTKQKSYFEKLIADKTGVDLSGENAQQGQSNESAVQPDTAGIRKDKAMEEEQKLIDYVNTKTGTSQPIKLGEYDINDLKATVDEMKQAESEGKLPSPQEQNAKANGTNQPQETIDSLKAAIDDPNTSQSERNALIARLTNLSVSDKNKRVDSTFSKIKEAGSGLIHKATASFIREGKRAYYQQYVLRTPDKIQAFNRLPKDEQNRVLDSIPSQ